MISKIITRNDTADNWVASAVPLAEGEIGYDKTNKILKIGDGGSLWSELPAMGGFTDAGVTRGSFFGSGNSSVSINVGDAKAKKLLMFCETTGTIYVDAAGIFSVEFDTTTKKGSLIYQGASTGYIGKKDETGFSVTSKAVTSNGRTEYVYTFRANNTLFQNGLKYVWFCIAKDIPTATSGYAQIASDKYTAPTSDTLLSSGITIDMGFRPRAFALFVQGKVQFNNNENFKVVSSFFSADDDGNIIHAGTNFAYKNSGDTICYSGYTENEKNIFYPSETGVYAGTANNVYLKGGATYKWFAVG